MGIGLRVSAFTIPTDAPESDGTFEWSATTLVLVEVESDGERGLGYSYADLATARLIEDRLADVIRDLDPMDISRAWAAMVSAVRNLGRPGIASMAIAAVDVALWDLKARLLAVPLATLLGRVRDAVPVYGSGGFTSYSRTRLQEQLSRWVQLGIPRVKMKVGREPDADRARVTAARAAIGAAPELYVDANGAHTPKEALAQAEAFAESDVRWFEEPVSSDDLEGLRLVRRQGPPGMAIAAGEYGYDLPYFQRMLATGSVDVLQADVTRCAGITEFLRVGALCQAHGVPLSAHCAPSLHVALGCALERLVHVEWFHDHVRIEQMLFEGSPEPVDGMISPDLCRPGLGLELKAREAEQHAA